MKVKINIPSAEQMIRRLGLHEQGEAQAHLTNAISGRITRYMPASSATRVLATKKKSVVSPTEIEVRGPYAKYQYYGKVMVDSVTGKGPAYIEGVGFRFRKGAILKATERDLEYTTTFNQKAGPFWDRALMAAEGDAITADLQEFINRRKR